MSTSIPTEKPEFTQPLGDFVENGIGEGRFLGGYRIRWAKSEADIRLAQSLRFLVFNLEMRHGGAEAFKTQLDQDEYDVVCDHLLVEEQATGGVVGTYRMQPGEHALKNLGYYSAREFDFSPYMALAPQMLELGRACIHKDHRNFTVLNLLWKGIAHYAHERKARYLIGCSSISTSNEAEAASAYSVLQRFLVEERYRSTPIGNFICDLTHQSDAKVKIPKLLSAYLALGAKICGAPAFDREFKCMDFLTWLDLESLPVRVLNRFLR